MFFSFFIFSVVFQHFHWYLISGITPSQFVIFNPWKLPWNWIVFYQNSFVISPDLLYHLIIRDYGRLANEAFTPNPNGYQYLNGLKITNCSGKDDATFKAASCWRIVVAFNKTSQKSTEYKPTRLSLVSCRDTIYNL